MKLLVSARMPDLPQLMQANILDASSFCDLLGATMLQLVQTGLVIVGEDILGCLEWLVLLVDTQGKGWAMRRKHNGTWLFFACDALEVGTTITSLHWIDRVPEHLNHNYTYLDGYWVSALKKVEGKMVRVDTDCIEDNARKLDGLLRLFGESDQALRKRLAPGLIWRIYRHAFPPPRLLPEHLRPHELFE